MKPPTALDKVGIRRTLMYVQKKLSECVRKRLALECDGDRHSDEWFKENVEAELFWMNESRAFWNYDFTPVDDGLLVAVQPRKHDNWIYIDITVSKECTSV